MQGAMILGFLAYYTALAVAFNFFLPKNSVWFTTFLAVVMSQTLVFGGMYFYSGYWDPWADIALVTTSAMCIPVSIVVATVFAKRRAKRAAHAHT